MNQKKNVKIDLPDLDDLKKIAQKTGLDDLGAKLSKLAGPDDLLAIVKSFREKDRQVQVLSRVIVIMGVLNAVATAPQIYTLYNSQDSGGLSLISWGYYLAFSVILLTYGLLKKQYPLIITYTLSTAAYAILVTGIVIYS